MTHAFSRTNIFSTSQFWCFPFISLTEDISDCPLHLLSQGQTMKKEACTSLQTGFGYEAKLNIRSHALRLFGSLPFIAVNVKGFPPLPAPLFRKGDPGNKPVLSSVSLRVRFNFLLLPNSEAEGTASKDPTGGTFLPFYAPLINTQATQLGHCPLSLCFSLTPEKHLKGQYREEERHCW